jgi:hypothetical protein
VSLQTPMKQISTMRSSCLPAIRRHHLPGVYNLEPSETGQPSKYTGAYRRQKDSLTTTHVVSQSKGRRQ